MTLVGCDLHSRKQQVAVLDTTTGEIREQELAHAGDAVEQFYRALPPPVTIRHRDHRLYPVVSRAHAPPRPHRRGWGGGKDPGDGRPQDKD